MDTRHGKRPPKLRKAVREKMHERTLQRFRYKVDEDTRAWAKIIVEWNKK